MTKRSSSTINQGRAVVVTTKDRGVFFGYVKDESKAPEQITLTKMRNCVYWPMAVRGFLGLTTSGPLSGSKIGPAAPAATLYGLTGVYDCTPEAVDAWEKGTWS